MPRMKEGEIPVITGRLLVLANYYKLRLSALNGSFTAVTRVQIPSGTPILFGSEQESE